MAGTTQRRVAEEDGGGAGSVGSERSAHCDPHVAVGAIVAKPPPSVQTAKFSLGLDLGCPADSLSRDEC